MPFLAFVEVPLNNSFLDCFVYALNLEELFFVAFVFLLLDGAHH